MSEYRSNLGHTVETHSFINPREYYRTLAEDEKCMDAKMTDALHGLGEQVPPNEDPRLVATTVLNGMFREDRRGMTRMASQMWNPTVSSDDTTQLPKEPGVLTPDEIMAKVTKKMAAISGEYPERILEWLDRNSKTEPIPYIQHMDESGHGSGTRASIQALRKANALTLKGPNMEIGSGPGNITAHLINAGILPEGNIHLVDSNKDWLGYASPLLKQVAPNFQTLLHPHKAETVDPEEKIGTTWTALTLQWFQDPASTVRNLQKIVAPEGNVFFIGETPVNATANTARGLYGGLDIGFSNGAFSYEDVCRMFEDNQFIPGETATTLRMSMPATPAEWFDRLNPEDKQKALLMRAYSDHLMVGTSWKPA